jgi:omega-amidase
MQLTISIIQTNLFWEDVHANLAMLGKKIEQVPSTTELIVLPEMFSTGFSMQPQLFAETMDGTAVTWMKETAIMYKKIITGSLIIKEEDTYYNRLIWMLPNGQYGYYNKRHLFAFAGEHHHYTAGNKRLIAQVKGIKINCQVCYDLRFPVWARQQVNEEKNAEYDVLLYVANWPEKRSHAWKTLLTARAIENQCYVVGVNRVGTDGNGIYHSGDSCIINPMGEVMYTKAYDEAIFTYTIALNNIQATRYNLPFLKDADGFAIST